MDELHHLKDKDLQNNDNTTLTICCLQEANLKYQNI